MGEVRQSAYWLLGTSGTCRSVETKGTQVSNIHYKSKGRSQVEKAADIYLWCRLCLLVVFSNHGNVNNGHILCTLPVKPNSSPKCIQLQSLINIF